MLETLITHPKAAFEGEQRQLPAHGHSVYYDTDTVIFTGVVWAESWNLWLGAGAGGGGGCSSGGDLSATGGLGGGRRARFGGGGTCSCNKRGWNAWLS